MFKFNLFLCLLLSSNCIVPSKTENATISYQNETTTISQFIFHTHTSTKTTTLSTSKTNFYPNSLISTSSPIIESNNSNNSMNHNNRKDGIDYKSTKFITIVSISGLIFLSSIIVITIALCNPNIKPKHKIYKVPSTPNLQSFDNPLFDYRANENGIVSGYKHENPTATLYDESYASYNDETY